MILKKSTYIQIRVEPELKEEFLKVCDERSINISDWFRKRMKEMIEEGKK